MKRIADTLYNVLDQYTGENVTYNKVTTIPNVGNIQDIHCDGIIYRKLGTEYFRRNFIKLTPEIFGADPLGISDSTNAIKKALDFLTLTSGGELSFSKGTYLTAPFIVPARVKLQGQGMNVSVIKLKTGVPTVTAFMDLTNSFASVVSDLSLDGSNVTLSALDGIKINATDTVNTVNRLRLQRFRVVNFSGNGINAIYGVGAFIFDINDVTISNCAKWGIYNTTTDNSFSQVVIATCRLGGIYNAGPNTRVLNTKLIFNGQDSDASAGLYSSIEAHRCTYIGIECQENYYHGISIYGNNNVVIGISDMNNVANRPLGVGNGLGLDTIGYGIVIGSATTSNKIKVEITSAFGIGEPKHTQYPYSFLSPLVTQENDVDLDFAPHSKRGSGIVKKKDYITFASTSWRTLSTIKYDGVSDGTYRYVTLTYDILYGAATNDQTSVYKKGAFQTQFFLTSNSAIVDLSKLYVDGIIDDVIRIVKKSTNSYEIQARAITGFKQTKIKLIESTASTAGAACVSTTTLLVSDGADVAALDITTASFYPRELKLPVVTKTASYTLTATDNVVLFNASSNLTCFLPTLLSSYGYSTGQIYTIKKIDSGSNTITIDANGTETIEGSLTFILRNQNESVTIQNIGSEWKIINYYNPNIEITQIKTASGTGSATTINIPHGLSYTPIISSYVANNAVSNVNPLVTADATNFIFNFTVAPVAGTNNLSYNISYRK